MQHYEFDSLDKDVVHGRQHLILDFFVVKPREGRILVRFRNGRERGRGRQNGRPRSTSEDVTRSFRIGCVIFLRQN